MRGLPVLLAIATGVTIGACGGRAEPDQRAQVDRYIRSTNAVERRFTADFERANTAYMAYSRGELPDESAEADMTRAEQAIHSAREQVGALRPPPDARALHDKLVGYLDMNLGIARELKRLAGYVPGAARALAPVDRANRRMRRRLDAAAGAADQARALDRFDAAVDRVQHRLRQLPVPMLLRRVHRSQVRRLSATRSLARRLERALTDQDAAAVARLLVRFRKTSSHPVTVHRLAAKAIARYNRRVRALGNAYADVLREQARLDRRLR